MKPPFLQKIKVHLFKPKCKFGCHPVWIKQAQQYIYFCNACGYYITKDTGCSNPFCPEEMKD